MNAKQALRAASRHIEDLEDYNRRASSEIKCLNDCIDSVIAGESGYCEWCEEQDECQREEKAANKGCDGWWLAQHLPAENLSSVTILEGEPEEGDDGHGIMGAGPTTDG